MLKIKLHPDRLFFWYSLFIACPALTLFGQNISVFFFLAILIYFFKVGYPDVSFSKGIQWLALFYALGAILSTGGSYDYGGKESFLRSLLVLPNYLYWALLIILLVQNRHLLNFNSIFRGITIGFILSLIYYYVIQAIPFVGDLPFIRKFSRNSFAFLMICFAPIVVYYIRDKYGKLAGIIAFLSISLIGLTLGSRSSSILVFLGCFLTFFLVGFISYRRTMIIGFFGLAFFLFISSNAGRRFISDLNPRTGELIYDFTTTMKTDRSYLVRRAMIDKGMNLFHQKPWTGIGLNSFNYTRGVIEGDFEGSELVIYKDIKEGTSSHNSYITILSEGGLFLSIPFALILITLFLHFFTRLRKMPDFHRPVFLGVLMMSVHLFFITAIVNVFGWYLLALAAALMYIRDSNYAELSEA